MNAGDSLNCELGSWTFGPGVEQVFDDHVRKSVPGYDLAHTIICLLSSQLFVSQENFSQGVSVIKLKLW